MRRAFIFILSFALIFTSFTPNMVSAEPAKPVEVSSNVFSVLTDAVIYSEDDNQTKELGNVVEGTTLLAERVENGRVYIQWSEDLAYISEEKVEFIDGETEDNFFSDNKETNGSFVILEESEVRTPDGDAFATLSKGIEYSFINIRANYYEIQLGHRIGYVDQSAVEEIAQEEESTVGNPENGKEEGETGENVEQDGENNQDIENQVIDYSVEEGTNLGGQAGLDDESKSDKVVNVQTFSIQSKAIPFGKYFKVLEDNLTVYDNSTGSLVPIGTLVKGQEYPRIRDYGNWHEIDFGNRKGYVWKESTQPSDGKSIKNLNENYKKGARSFKALTDLTVYDNTSGELVPFATIKKGQQHPIVSDYGNWYRVDVSGRIGYVHKNGVQVAFNPNDQYFRVMEDGLTVYDNRTGKLVPIGTLEKGQVYPRVSNYGNWHRIQFGNRYGYVWKESTLPADSTSIKNLNKNYKNSARSFKALTDLTVYDNTSGELVTFATIKKGQQHPIVSDYGNWYRVDVSGRIGYVNKSGVKVAFSKSDRYFEVTEDNLTVYDNSKGSLKPIGTLLKGQHYPRVSDYGNWHRIQFGDRYGYVWQAGTLPSNGQSIKNVNTEYKSSKGSFITLQDLTVYDNSSGSLVPFATIHEGESFEFVSTYGPTWYRVDVAGRIGYVSSSGVEVESGIKYTQYSVTLNEALNIQMGLSTPPQTDRYPGAGYVHRDYIKNGKVSLQNEDSVLNVRNRPNGSIIGSLRDGQSVNITATVGNWHEIDYRVSGTWQNAKRKDVIRYLDPDNPDHDRFQHLVLSKSANITVDELNKVLNGRGILAGKASAFIEAGKKHSINEIYLVSHALLETGNGSSQLATGVKVSGRTVYNVFGVGAADSCPIDCGAQFAYNQGWFTPEQAIVGGAKFISERYVHHPTYKQDTLYKMRWNPKRPGVHQYATDIGWAVKQVSRIKGFYDQLSSYDLSFDIPRYK